MAGASIVRAWVRIRNQIAEKDQSGAPPRHEGFCACDMSRILQQIEFEPRNPCQLLSNPLQAEFSIWNLNFYPDMIDTGIILSNFLPFLSGVLLGHHLKNYSQFLSRYE